MRLALVLVLLVSVCAAPQPLPPAPQAATLKESFAAFWPRFRTALLAGRSDQLSELTQFPLEVRGTLDSDTSRRISPSQFSTFLTRVLAEDSGLSVTQPETNRVLIDHLPEADPKQRGVNIRDDVARIGPLGFARRQDGWRLVRLYRESD
jgi:hypothetical protein